MTTVGQPPDGNESVSCELFDDEEPPELIAYQVNDRSFISTFHCSRFNKDVFPGRFQLDLARSQKKPYQSNDESSRNGQLQRKIHQPAATMAPTLTLRPRTSFMFWAKGLPSGSSPESCHHRVTTSEPLKANSTPSGRLRKHSKGLNRIKKATCRPPISSTTRVKTGLNSYVNVWLKAQIIEEQSHSMDSSHKNLQYQHTFTELEYSRNALSNARLHRYGSSSPLTKESTDDNYEARVFNNPDERNFENQSSFINAESQSDFRPPPQQLYSNIKRELPYCDFYATSPIFSNLDHLSDDGKQMLTYGTKCVSGHSNYMDRSPCSSSDTVRRFNSTTRNTTPLPSKMILMVYGYKSMLLSTSSLVHEQPALILNIKSDLKYKDVMRIISDFFLETPKALSVQEPHLNTTHTLSTCSPTISTTADRGSKDYNSSLWGTALGRRGTMGRHWVDIYYLHPVLKIWRFVKHRAVWSAAVLLSLESKKPLRVMISQNYEEEIRENFSPKSPEGMHYERRLARSMGDPKKLLPLFNADVHYQQGSSKLISTFRHSVEAQKTKRNSLLEDNSVCKISPFIIAQKEKHQSPVMKSLKQQKMGSIVGRKERYSSYESNFIIQQKFGGFLPRKGNSKADMKYPQDNRATPSSVISKSYAQPYVSISNDSIHVANFN